MKINLGTFRLTGVLRPGAVALAFWLTACGGGGGGASTAPVTPALTGNTAIHAAVVSGYQVFQGGLSYPLLQVQATLPPGNALKPALAAVLQKRLGASALALVPALPLQLDTVLSLYSAGFTISGNSIQDQFFSDSAGTQSAGNLVVSYPAGTTISSLGVTSATLPVTMSISANITGGTLPMSGSGTIRLNDASGAGEIKGTLNLTATSVQASADLNLDAAGNITGSATITQNGQTITVTGLSGPFTGTITGNVAVAPQGYTGTVSLSLAGSFSITLATPSGTATGSFGTGGLTIAYPDGSQEAIVTPLTTQPATPPATATISGTLYTDTNKNGVLDNTETGIPSLTVTLTGPSGSTTTTTASTGAYAFSNLAAGSYTVSSPATSGTAALETQSPISVTLASGQNAAAVNFGYLPPPAGTVTFGVPVTLGLGTAGVAPDLPLGINNLGQIIGQSPNSSSGVFWSGPAATAQPLPQLAGGTVTLPSVINNSGEIIGEAFNVLSGSPVWATPTSAPTLVAAGNFQSLNDNGQIVGFNSFWASASSQAATLGPLPGFAAVQAMAINASGLIVGMSINSGLPFQPTFWSSPTSGPAALPGLPETFNAFYVNSAGQIIGAFNNTIVNTNGGVWFWSSVAAQPVLLPALAGGGVLVNGNGFAPEFALNAAGTVVGTSSDSLANPRAVIWTNGLVQDLNTLIPPGSGWVLQRATGINDTGGIIGTGTLNGTQASFYIAPL